MGVACAAGVVKHLRLQLHRTNAPLARLPNLAQHVLSISCISDYGQILLSTLTPDGQVICAKEIDNDATVISLAMGASNDPPPGTRLPTSTLSGRGGAGGRDRRRNSG